MEEIDKIKRGLLPILILMADHLDSRETDFEKYAEECTATQKKFQSLMTSSVVLYRNKQNAKNTNTEI